MAQARQQPTPQRPRSHDPDGPPEASASNGAGAAALVVGIAALGVAWVPGLNVVLGILAVTLGAIGYGRVRNGTTTANRRSSIGGMVLGLLSICLAIVLMVVVMSDGTTY